MDLITSGGSSTAKESPVAALYSSCAGWTSGSATTGIVKSFSDFFSAQDTNNGSLTCSKAGRYKISAGMRCRYCYFYVYVNDVTKISIYGNNGTGSQEFIKEIEIDLNEGDKIRASSVWITAERRYSCCYANIFDA